MRRRTEARRSSRARASSWTGTNEELKQKGVQFAGAPEERFYGVEAIMKDGLGNWFSVTQPKDH